MTATGTIKFDVPRQAALHAGLWILVYGRFDHGLPNWSRLAASGDCLIKSWKRKGRRDSVTIEFRRDDATLLWEQLPRQRVVGSIFRSDDTIRDDAALVGALAIQALRRRPGRPKNLRAKVEESAGKSSNIAERTHFRNKAEWRRIEARDKARLARIARQPRIMGSMLEGAEFPE